MISRLLTSLIFLTISFLSLSLKAADSQTPLAGLIKGDRVVFVGDSITYSGGYIEMLEIYVRIKHPESKVEIINLGLPSETVSGLSEPGHANNAFPRPVLEERLARVLQKAKPNLIVACYGMNDGIYHPFSEERLQKFQEGIQSLRGAARILGIQVIHLTPPVFDSHPIIKNTLPAGLAEYRQPYVGYDEVLDRYSTWLVGQRKEGWSVVDVHGPMRKFLDDKRMKDSNFLLASDGVHLNGQGQWLVAREILKGLGASPTLTDAETEAPLLALHPGAAGIRKLVSQRQALLRDAWLTEVRHVRPGIGAGKPMAQAQEEASALLARIHEARGP